MEGAAPGSIFHFQKLRPRLLSAALDLRRRRGDGASGIVVLEADAEAELHRPRTIGPGIVIAVALTRQVAKGVRTAESEADRIQQLSMVQYVGENDLELAADTLRDPDVFLDAHIHVPVGQSGENAPASVLRVQTEDRITEVVIYGLRVGEEIDGQSLIAKAHRACRAVDRVAPSVG